MAWQIDTRINIATVGSILAAILLFGLYVGRIEATVNARLDAHDCAISEIRRDHRTMRDDARQLAGLCATVDGILTALEDLKQELKLYRGVK